MGGGGVWLDRDADSLYRFRCAWILSDGGGGVWLDRDADSLYDFRCAWILSDGGGCLAR